MTEGTEQDALVEALRGLGAKRVEAVLVHCMLRGRARRTQDILEETGLRQPEVSVGMQELRDRGWVETESIPREGKGRPMHRYRLTATPAQMRAFYVAMGQRQVKAYRAWLESLKAHLR